MPLYLITPNEPADDLPDGRKLVDAISEQAALKHITASLFSSRRITKPTEVATLVKAGVPVETAGEEQPLPERVDAETGNVLRGFEVVRPATLAELAESDPMAAGWRIDPKGGLVQRLPKGADGPEAWEDIREATAEEIAEVKAEVSKGSAGKK